MPVPPIYLDYAATTPMCEEVQQYMVEQLSQRWANPASLHSSGRRALTELEDAKDCIKAMFLGSQSLAYAQWHAWQVIITSGGTEANNLALHALRPSGSPLLVGATEHPSILSPAQTSRGLSPYVSIVPVSPSGQPNIDALQLALSPQGHTPAHLRGHTPPGNASNNAYHIPRGHTPTDLWGHTPPGNASNDAAIMLRGQTPSGFASFTKPPLVSLMLGNNETGVMPDIAGISKVCRRQGAALHTDAVQAFGKIDMQAILPMVDAITISAHKLCGPVGVGALLVRSELRPQPLLFGGGQQLGIRPGTESVVLTTALAKACQLAEARRLAGSSEILAALRSRFEQQLIAAVPHAQIIGAESPRLPHISCIGFPGWDRQALLMSLDMAGIQCSSGSACASGSSLPSHVLSAMQLPSDVVAGAIRFSFGHATTQDEIDMAVRRIANIFSKTK